MWNTKSSLFYFIFIFHLFLHVKMTIMTMWGEGRYAIGECLFLCVHKRILDDEEERTQSEGRKMENFRGKNTNKFVHSMLCVSFHNFSGSNLNHKFEWDFSQHFSTRIRLQSRENVMGLWRVKWNTNSGCWLTLRDHWCRLASKSRLAMRMTLSAMKIRVMRFLSCGKFCWWKMHVRSPAEWCRLASVLLVVTKQIPWHLKHFVFTIQKFSRNQFIKIKLLFFYLKKRKLNYPNKWI